MRDYHRYRYSLREHMRYFSEALFLILLVSYLFYHSLIAILLIIPFYPVFLRIKAKRLLQQQKQELSQQFKEAIASVAAALNAGYSVENAWREAKTEMEQMYGEHALIVQELCHIQVHLSMNVPLEELLNDFARRSDIEDVSSFCQVFFFAKRSGNDIKSNKNAQSVRSNLTPKMETIHAETVVPMFAPIITLMAWGNVIKPAFEKPTTITVVADED